ncbi:MAG: sulfatase-like hydrolase/transferase [Chthoniobacteraceae bacterium]
MKLLRFLLCLFVSTVTAFAADSKPNIVFILCDDLGVNDLSCYGRKDQPTPNLDRLASEGVRFTSSMCAAPICSASRAAIMTGKFPARLHITNFLPGRADAASQSLLQPEIEGQLPLEEITIAELLRDAGYATACIGKWHLGGPGFGPREQGFAFAFPGHPNTKPSATEGSKGEYELTAQAEQWLDEHKGGPFFLYLAHNTPHIPFAALPEDIAHNAGAWNPTYAAVIGHLDDCVGRIMAKIDALGLRERTIFVFTSDNGGLSVLEFPGTPSTHNGSFRAGKGYLYEGGLRIPLIIRWPGTVKPGWVSDTPVVLTDLVPTLAGAAGVDVAKTTGPLDGVDLRKFLSGDELAPRTFFWHMPNYTNQGSRPAGAVREGEWKLVEHYEDGRTELFNLARDVGEKNDIAGEQSARVATMKAQLADWRLSIGAQECRPNPAFDAALHRKLYVDTDPSRFPVPKTAAEAGIAEEGWRSLMNSAVAGSKHGQKGPRPRVTPAKGDIRLFAKDARVHATNMRYEPQTYKNTLGYWTKPEDWADWEFDVPAPGRYEVEITQGCGKGSGGAKVAVEVAGTVLDFTVQDTGHFQDFIQRTIGTVQLPAGKQTLAVKPQTKPGAAVMDLRRVVLRPIAD